MKRLARVALAGAMATMALGGAGAANASVMASDYRITVYNDASFTAKFCLLSQGYGADRSVQERCSGERMTMTHTDISVPRRDGDRIWMNVLVQAAPDVKQITIHNGYNNQVNEHVFDTSHCMIHGNLGKWWVTCRKENEGNRVFYRWN